MAPRRAPWRAAPRRPGMRSPPGQPSHPLWEKGSGGPASERLSRPARVWWDGECGRDMGCVEARVAAGEQRASRGATGGRIAEIINRWKASGCYGSGPRTTSHVAHRALARERAQSPVVKPVGGAMRRAFAEAIGQARAFMAWTSSAGPRAGAPRPLRAQGHAAASRAPSQAGQASCVDLRLPRPLGSAWGLSRLVPDEPPIA